MTNLKKFTTELAEILDHNYGDNYERNNEAIDQIKQLISETIGEDENPVYATLTRADGGTVESIDPVIYALNNLRKSFRHAFNLKGE